MWSQESHQPPMSSYIGLRGFGQWRSSKTQNSSFSVSDVHSIGNVSSPRNWPRTSSFRGTAASSFLELIGDTAAAGYLALAEPGGCRARDPLDGLKLPDRPGSLPPPTLRPIDR